MKRVLSSLFVLALVVSILGIAGIAQAETVTIYQDSFNTPGKHDGSSLDGTAPNVAAQDFGGINYAGHVWDCAGSETGWWGQTNQGTAPNTYVHASSSDFLAFTPVAGEIYTVTATIAAVSGTDWFTLAFVPVRGNWANGNGTPLYNQPKVIDLSDGNSDRGLVRGGATKTISLTLDTTAPGWTNSLGIAYVGWVTDTPGRASGANISNFSLTATRIAAFYTITGTVICGGSPVSGATVYFSTTSGGPYSTVTAGTDGTFSISVPGGSGPYYVKAGKAPDYIDSSEVTIPAVTSNVTGVNLTLTPTPATTVSGVVSDSLGAVSGASVSYSLSASGPFTTITTAADGSYSFTALQNQTYYVKAFALSHSASAVTAVPVLTVPVTNNILLDRTIVTNGDFSVNGAQFTSYPGYCSGTNPAAPTAWTGSPATSIGVNGVPGVTVFGPGTNPGGFWCFMQNGGTSIRQDISVTPGQKYVVSYSVAGRSGYPAGAIRGFVSPDGGTTDAAGLTTNPVSTSAFQAVKFYFTATSATTSLIFKNLSPAGDYTVDVTNISVAESTDVEISGTVTDGTNPIAGATVSYSTTSGGPYSTVTTDSSGAYRIDVPANSGTYYIKAGAATYFTSPEHAPVVVGTANITGINFVLTRLPAIKGKVTDSVSGAGVAGASVTVSPNPADSESAQTVITDASGNYTAYVLGSKTYAVSVAKTRYISPSAVDVPVATSDVVCNFVLTKIAANKLVDLDASSLPTGALTTWPNPGTLGGSFDNATSTATVVADATLGKNVVQFSGGAQDVLRSTFTMATSSNIVGPDCQYATATWLNATAAVTTGRYLQWAHGPWTPASAMWFNYGTIAWGVTDHLNSTFLPWGAGGYPGTGAWHLLICQFDGTTESAYLDGKLISSATRYFNPTPGATMDVGCSDFQGYIAKLQVYDEALSIKDIAHLNGKYVIEGKVTLPDGTTPVAGATITLDGANAATSAADGTYMIIVVPGTYTVGATKANMITITADQSVTVAAADVSNVDFQMYTMPIISGKVTLADNVTPVAGVALRLNTGATTNSAADGTYSFGVPGNTFYTLTITAPAGYSIVGPAVRGIDVGTENVPDINFVLAANSITGRVINGAGAGIYNAIVQIGGVGGPAAVTDDQGYYTMAFNAGGVSEVYADALGYANNAASVDLSAGGSITAPTITLASKDETDASYIQNGNFESGALAPWTLDPGDAPTAIELGVSSAEKFSGSYSGYWKGLDGVVTYAGWLTQHVPVVAGSTYNVYFKVKSSRPGILSQTAWKFLDAEGNDLNYREMSEGDTGGHVGWLTSLNGTWQQAVNYRDYNFANPGAACRIEAPAGAAYIVVWTNSASATVGDEVWIDDVVIDRVGDIYVPPVTGPIYGCNNKVCLTDAKLTGKLVKVWGKIQSFGTGSYTISDGYSAPVTIIGTTTGFAGDLVVVTGTRQVDGTVKP